MNSPAVTMPGFRSLYWSDLVIRRTLHAATMGAMLAFAGWFMHQQAPAALPDAEQPIETVYAPWIGVAGITLALLAGLLVLRRYLLVRDILRNGDTIPGIADVVDVYDTNMHGDSHTIKTTPTYAYYVTIRYEVQGDARQARFKLLHSPSTYGIRKGEKVELLVLPSVPHKPLIRSVYLGRPGR